jgi:hypothetical protein
MNKSWVNLIGTGAKIISSRPPKIDGSSHVQPVVTLRHWKLVRRSAHYVHYVTMFLRKKQVVHCQACQWWPKKCFQTTVAEENVREKSQNTKIRGSFAATAKLP